MKFPVCTAYFFSKLFVLVFMRRSFACVEAKKMGSLARLFSPILILSCQSQSFSGVNHHVKQIIEEVHMPLY